MSRNWTAEEIQAASAAMKAASQLSYDEFRVEISAISLVSRFAQKQEGGHFACPRCGRMDMADNVARNALSRRVNVYICDECGMSEALEDVTDNRALISSWAICKKPYRWNMPLVLTHIGRDSWSRPVYECGNTLYVDVDPCADCTPNICTKYRNEFDGEPCDHVPENAEIEFVPCRDTW